jgi:hypothetical protein
VQLPYLAVKSFGNEEQDNFRRFIGIAYRLCAAAQIPGLAEKL